MAVTVADDLQGMGIGAELATRTVKRARANGVAILIATTLWENLRGRGA
jgi:GNAT superfamily N-acetyltransferase